jgi:hypothetical protein
MYANLAVAITIKSDTPGVTETLSCSAWSVDIRDKQLRIRIDLNDGESDSAVCGDDLVIPLKKVVSFDVGADF